MWGARTSGGSMLEGVDGGVCERAFGVERHLVTRQVVAVMQVSGSS